MAAWCARAWHSVQRTENGEEKARVESRSHPNVMRSPQMRRLALTVERVPLQKEATHLILGIVLFLAGTVALVGEGIAMRRRSAAVSVPMRSSFRTKRAPRSSDRGADVVEARGVEPLSEDRQRTASTCVADSLRFAAIHAHRLA